MKTIPNGPSLVVLVGPSGSGKTTFRQRHFEERVVVSSDDLRMEMTGDILRQDKNDIVFEEFNRRIVAKIRAGQRVVADATHLRDKDRILTAENGVMLNVPVTYVVIDRPLEAKLQTAGWRANVVMKGGLGLIETHTQTFKANEKKILAGDRLATLVVDTRVDEFRVATQLPRETNNERWFTENGFDAVRVIGDVHGNMEGFEKSIDVPESTFLLFLGDLLDYDSRGVEVVRRVYKMVMEGKAITLRGNHEAKIWRWATQGDNFRGRLSNGNEATTNVVKAMTAAGQAEWKAQFMSLMDMSPDWIQLGRWMFAHGAVHERMWGNHLFRAPKNSKLESFAMYGETTGNRRPDGYPERIYTWVDKIPARTVAIVGHAVLSTDEVPLKTGALGGKAYFLDTGSSKEINSFDSGPVTPRKGHLSWMDFKVKSGKAISFLEFESFGRE